MLGPLHQFVNVDVSLGVFLHILKCEPHFGQWAHNVSDPLLHASKIMISLDQGFFVTPIFLNEGVQFWYFGNVLGYRV